MSKNPLKTPCIGLCSTVYGDRVCRGCKRFDFEIIGWNTYTNEQQLAIWQRLEQLLQQIMANKLTITDSLLLKEKLIKYNIRFNLNQSPQYWAYLLLAKGARQIKHIEAYGISLLSPFDQQPLWQLKEQIDIEYFSLSTKHYPK